MNNLIMIAFVLMVSGLMVLLDISPIEIFNHLKSYRPKKSRVSIRQKVLNVTQKKKSKGIKRLLRETKEILIMTGRENNFYFITTLSLILSVVGMIFALLIGNKLLMPILGVGFALMPFWYVKLISTKWKNELNGELETVLSVVTTSYMRCDSIITAIEENIDYINQPVYNIFNAFLADTKLINSNINMALEKLREKIDSDVFREWVDAIMDCQEDKNLKSTLTPIVSKLSDMRIVSAELDNMLYEPIKEFMMMAALLLGNIPLIYFLNRDWYHTLMHTPVGKGTLAICTIVLVISISGVVKLSRPVEYRR
jgi:Flp pilus assembly protein TadB